MKDSIGLQVNNNTESWRIFCFVCKKGIKFERKPFESKRDIRCPNCNKKEAVITNIPIHISYK